MTALAASRPSLLRRAIRLEQLTVGWNVVEGVVAIGAGMVAGSVALIGFGVDSGRAPRRTAGGRRASSCSRGLRVYPPVVRSAELAGRIGIAQSAVRRYEKAGPLPAAKRAESGDRSDTDADAAGFRSWSRFAARVSGLVAPVASRLCLDRVRGRGRGHNPRSRNSTRPSPASGATSIALGGDPTEWIPRAITVVVASGRRRRRAGSRSTRSRGRSSPPRASAASKGTWHPSIVNTCTIAQVRSPLAGER